MSEHKTRGANYDELWAQCRQANSECFETLRIVHLDRPSWFLPQGDVVFQVIDDPDLIPDNPPRGVRLRHDEAKDLFGDRARFYLLRPTFTKENGTLEVYTGDHAEDDADWDRSDIVFMARLYGPAFRTAMRARQLAVKTIDVGLQIVEATSRAVVAAGAKLQENRERRQLRREARSIAPDTHPQRLASLVRRAEALYLFDEAERFQRALGTWHARGGRALLDTLDHRFESQFLDTVQEDRLATTRRLATETWRELKTAYRQIAELMYWDPVLCFELDEQPGTLWLESHWFEGQDGKTYVHY